MDAIRDFQGQGGQVPPQVGQMLEGGGMSQGAIYRYYNGLDEILADMATKMRSDYNIIDSFEILISSV